MNYTNNKAREALNGETTKCAAFTEMTAIGTATVSLSTKNSVAESKRRHVFYASRTRLVVLLSFLKCCPSKNALKSQKLLYKILTVFFTRYAYDKRRKNPHFVWSHRL